MSPATAGRADCVGVLLQSAGMFTRTRWKALPGRSPSRSPPSHGTPVSVSVRPPPPGPEMLTEKTTEPSDFLVIASSVCADPYETCIGVGSMSTVAFTRYVLGLLSELRGSSGSFADTATLSAKSRFLRNTPWTLSSSSGKTKLLWQPMPPPVPHSSSSGVQPSTPYAV